MKNNQNKKNAYTIIKELYKDKNSLSVTLTGSYSEHFDLDAAGDIDIVVVCKNLSKKYFNNCVKITKSFQKKIFKNKKEVIVNSTFGPIKFYKKNTVVFHLMIYDLKSHIEHTLKSPFTCYDWERSKAYLGKSLRELSPVYKLQLRDFYEARRSTKEYLNDIIKNRISYRKYNFIGNKITLKKKYFKIDKLNQKDFIYHTIKFLIVNWIKFEKNINSKISNNEINNKFYRISGKKKDLEIFKKLRGLKNKKSNKNIENPRKFALNFIDNYNNYINKNVKESKTLYFLRHQKTKMSSKIFLGQNMDPHILSKKIPSYLKRKKFDLCFSSPSKRSMETANLFCKKKIHSNNLLKEIDYGKAENLNFNQLKNKFPNLVLSWIKKKDPRFPGGESTSDVLKRVNLFLKFILKQKNLKKKILIVTHNVFLRCLLGNNYNLDINTWFNIKINYLDIFEFVTYNKKIRPNINRENLYIIFKKINKNYA